MKSLPNIDYGMLKIASQNFDAELASILEKLTFNDGDLYVSTFLAITRLHKQFGGINDEVKTAEEKPVGKYANLKNYVRERSGVDVDDVTLDKKLRTFFEDIITEILKNPAEYDRTRNVNFMELYDYLSGQDGQEELPKEVQAKIKKQAVRSDSFDVGEAMNVIEKELPHHGLTVINIDTDEHQSQFEKWHDDGTGKKKDLNIIVDYDSLAYGGELPNQISQSCEAIKEKIGADMWWFNPSKRDSIIFHYEGD